MLALKEYIVMIPKHCLKKTVRIIPLNPVNQTINLALTAITHIEVVRAHHSACVIIPLKFLTVIR